MTNQLNNITSLSISGLLDNKDNYVIPMYQRNYAWGEGEITQLIQDIIDYCLQNNSNNYYLGTLVVFERKIGNSIVYETIDGQQRLTTLTILLSVIKNKYQSIDLEWFTRLNLEFDSRKISTETLNAAFIGKFGSNYNYNIEIKSGYELIEKILPIKLSENENLSIEIFCKYLFEKVKILRVPVPEDTELNHYFEIMNNRGEQLEKHEILKSKFLEILNSADETNKEHYSQWFHIIWESCSNMEKYVQYGFNTDQRNSIFGTNDWNNFKIKSFDELCLISIDGSNSKYESTKLLLSEIIVGKTVEKLIQNKEDNPDRFNSVINFPNFLLHVLRVQVKEDIPLDDKRLLKIFEDQLSKKEDRINFVKEFIFNLLKCKFLFDKYIIKREFIAGTDKWSLKKLKLYENNKVSYINTFGTEENDIDENRTILMLLSMFHVSNPTLVYKHWLNAAIFYVFNQSEIKPNLYIQYLKNLANAFLFDRFLTSEPINYFEIIYKNSGIPKNSKDYVDTSYLTFGNLQNNLVFNYLDYLLWCKYANSDSKIRNFEFAFRSSVEHYYPQHPMTGFDPLEEIDLNSFGNLCLISSSKNSRLSNFMPTAKQEHYAAQTDIDSVKQYIMMSVYKPNLWNKDSISDHNEKMTTLIMSCFDSNQTIQPLNVSKNENKYIETVNDKPKAIKWFEDFQKTHKSLLGRALMCFGQIDFEIGWTSGGEKWNFFQWEGIKERDAYLKYLEYVSTNNPENLEKIIEEQLRNNKALREDSYRYVFVSRPEAIEYCLEGNFGWVNSGKKIILIKSIRAGVNSSCDLYTFFLSRYLKNNYSIDTYLDNDRLYISLNDNDGNLTITTYDSNCGIFLEIWNDDIGQLCYEINTNDLHGNSKVIRNLKESGWDYNDSKRLFYTNKPILCKISNDIEFNITESEKKLDSLIKFF